MLDITQDIQSLTEFKRRTSELAEQMRETGRPIVLTVNGKAELVVQDAVAYQRLIDKVERAEAIAGIQRGLDSMHRGEGIPIDAAMDEIRQRHGL